MTIWPFENIQPLSCDVIIADSAWDFVRDMTAPAADHGGRRIAVLSEQARY
jgi:hypothetical protein